MKIKLKKLHTDAVVPTYATDGAACFDLHVVDCGHQSPIYREGQMSLRTGLAFEVPDTHVMLIFSRSGHGFKNDTRLANCVGVIDSDYRGEVAVRLTRDSGRTDILRVNPGDRIAQALLMPVERVSFEVVDELSETERGAGGFGSSGQ